MMKYRGMMESSPNLGTLSISSLAGTETNIDDASEDDDFDATAALYQRLHDLEKMTQTFLNERPIRLNNQHDSFTDVDKGSKQDFDLEILEFQHDQVLCLSIYCIPETVNDESMYILDEAPKIVREHQPLDIVLYQITSSSSAGAIAVAPATTTTPTANPTNADQSYTPSLHNGEYSFALTSAAGLVPGSYRLVIHNIGFATQPIRVTQKIVQEVRATPIRPSQKVVGCNGANEFSYYRFTSTSTTQLITIRAKPVFDASNSPIGDPDLYVTNRYNGLVAVDKENFVWKSTNVGADRVDIHPQDLDMVRGSTFVIGILGYKDRNEFEIEVSVSDPRPIRQLEVGESIEVLLSTDDPKHFSLHVDSGSKARLFMTVTPLSDSMLSAKGESEYYSQYNKIGDTAVDEDTLGRLVSQAYGRCVYTSDGLAAFGLLEKSFWQDARGSPTSIPPMPTIIKAQSMSVDNKSLFAAALPQALPPSLCLDRGLFPVAHMSSCCMYPSPEDYSWRGSGTDGSILVMLENDEWKYTNGNCYISLSAIRMPTPETGSAATPSAPSTHQSPEKRSASRKSELMSPSGSSPASLNCRVTLWESSALDRLSSDMKDRYDIFQSVFRDIDGSNVSQRERSRVGREDQALTYGEVEFLSFIEILRVAGASHGDVFYDLGCGAGKAVVASALSGIQFLRCVGLELLPGLCVLAKEATVSLKNSLKSSSSSSIVDGNGEGSIRQLPPMEIREADILVADWSAADVVYISSICFSDSFVQSIFEKSKALKPGSKFITLKLPGSLDGWFEVDSQAWYKMTWGRIMVYVLRRTTFRGD